MPKPDPRWPAEGQALKELLTPEGQKLNVSALAREAGLKRQLIYSWFRGEHNPSADKRAHLVAGATALGIGVSDEQIAALYGEEVVPQQMTLAEAIKAQADAITEHTAAVTSSLGRITVALEVIAGINPPEAPALADLTHLLKERAADEPGPARKSPRVRRSQGASA